jgi:hypothetical protein
VSEKLTPKVGDRVRLVHTNGDEATVTVADTLDNARRGEGIEAETLDFWLNEGWSVAEILPKPLPPAGTFIKGIVKGAAFCGVTSFSDDVARVSYMLSDGCAYLADAGELDSWEVIDA